MLIFGQQDTTPPFLLEITGSCYNHVIGVIMLLYHSGSVYNIIFFKNKVSHCKSLIVLYLVQLYIHGVISLDYHI